MTFAYGDEFVKSKDFQIFKKSCEAIDADLIFVPHIVEIKPNTILRDRHLCFYDFLLNCNYEKCLICDSRDVIIQDDPFTLTGDLVLTCEGMRHRQSVWNLTDQFMFQKNLNGYHLDKESDLVLNGGVIYGTPQRLAWFCFAIWALAIKSDSSDQAIINYLSNFQTIEVAGYDFCITGEGIKEGFVKVEERDGKFYHDNKLCKIFHQWDRTQWAGVIREKFKV